MSQTAQIHSRLPAAAESTEAQEKHTPSDTLVADAAIPRGLFSSTELGASKFQQVREDLNQSLELIRKLRVDRIINGREGNAQPSQSLSGAVAPDSPLCIGIRDLEERVRFQMRALGSEDPLTPQLKKMTSRLNDSLSTIREFSKRLELGGGSFKQRGESIDNAFSALSQCSLSIRNEIESLGRYLESVTAHLPEVRPVDLLVQELKGRPGSAQPARSRQQEKADEVLRALSARAAEQQSSHSENAVSGPRLESGSQNISDHMGARSKDESREAFTVLNEKLPAGLHQKLAVSEMLLPIAGDGSVASLEEWLRAQGKDELITYTECLRQELPDAGQRDGEYLDLSIPVCAGTQMVSIPFGYEAVAFDARDFTGREVEDGSRLSLCSTGTCHVQVDENCSQIILRLKANHFNAGPQEQIVQALAEVLPAVSGPMHPFSASVIEHHQQSRATLSQKANEVAQAFRAEDLVYTTSAALHKILKFSGENDYAFLNGLRSGSCITLAYQLCARMHQAGVPAVIVSGNFLRSGEREYLGNPGHALVMTLTPHPQFFDPTTWTKAGGKIDLENIDQKLWDRILSLPDLSPEGAHEVGEATRAATETGRSRDGNSSGHNIQDDLSHGDGYEFKKLRAEAGALESCNRALEHFQQTGQVSTVANFLESADEDIRSVLKMVGDFGKAPPSISRLAQLLCAATSDPEISAKDRNSLLIKTFALCDPYNNPLSEMFLDALEPLTRREFVSEGLSNRHLDILAGLVDRWPDGRQHEGRRKAIQMYLAALDAYRDSGDSQAPDQRDDYYIGHIEILMRAHSNLSGTESAPLYEKIEEQIMSLAQFANTDPLDAFFHMAERSAPGEDLGVKWVMKSLAKNGHLGSTWNKGILDSVDFDAYFAERVAQAIESGDLKQSAIVTSFEALIGRPLSLESHRERIEAAVRLLIRGGDLNLEDTPIPTSENPAARILSQLRRRYKPSTDVEKLSDLAAAGGLRFESLRSVWPEESQGKDTALASIVSLYQQAPAGSSMISQQVNDLIFVFPSGHPAKLPFGCIDLLVADPEFAEQVASGQELEKVERIRAVALEATEVPSNINVLRAFKEQYPEKYRYMIEALAPHVDLKQIQSKKAYERFVPNAESMIINTERLLARRVIRNVLEVHGSGYTPEDLSAAVKAERKSIQSGQCRLTDAEARTPEGQALVGLGVARRSIVMRMAATRTASHYTLSHLISLGWEPAADSSDMYQIHDGAQQENANSILWRKTLQFQRHKALSGDIRDEDLKSAMRSVFLHIRDARQNTPDHYLQTVEDGKHQSFGRTNEFRELSEYSSQKHTIKDIHWGASARGDRLVAKNSGAKREGPEATSYDIQIDAESLLCTRKDPPSSLAATHGFIAAALAKRKNVNVTVHFRGVPIMQFDESEIRQDFLRSAQERLSGQDLFKALWSVGADVRSLLVEESNARISGGPITTMTPTGTSPPKSRARHRSEKGAKMTVLIGASSRIAATVKNLSNQQRQQVRQIPVTIRNLEELLLPDD